MLILRTILTRDKAIYLMFIFHQVKKKMKTLPKSMNFKSLMQLKKITHSRKNKTKKKKSSRSKLTSPNPKMSPRKQWASTFWLTKKSVKSQEERKIWSSIFLSTVTRSKNNNSKASHPKSLRKTTLKIGLRQQDPLTGPRRDSPGPLP